MPLLRAILLAAVLAATAACGGGDDPATGGSDSLVVDSSAADPSVADTSATAASEPTPHPPGELLYVAPDTASACQVAHVRMDGTRRHLTDTPTGKTGLAFDASARRVYVRTSGNRIRSFPLDRALAGSPVTETDSVPTPDGELRAYDVHPDGGLVVSMRTEGPQDRKVLLWRRGSGIDTLAAEDESGGIETRLRVDSTGTLLVRRFEWPESSGFGFVWIQSTKPERFVGEFEAPVFTDSTGVIGGVYQKAAAEPTFAVTYSLDRQAFADLVSCADPRRPVVLRGYHAVEQRFTGSWMAVVSDSLGLCRNPRQYFEQAHGRSRIRPVLAHVRRSRGNAAADSVRMVYDESVVRGILGVSPTARRTAFVADIPADTTLDGRPLADSLRQAAGEEAVFVYNHTTGRSRIVAHPLGECGEADPRDTAIWIPAAE